MLKFAAPNKILAAVLLAVVVLSFGCGTTLSRTDFDEPRVSIACGSFTAGDQLKVSFGNGSSVAVGVGADDSIGLPGGITIVAARKSPKDLQEEIQQAYLSKGTDLAPVVVTTGDLFVVDGDVRSPGRYWHSGQITVVTAIETAGGFTSFSNTNKVMILRAKTGKREQVAWKKVLADPKHLPIVYPGDCVVVH